MQAGHAATGRSAARAAAAASADSPAAPRSAAATAPRAARTRGPTAATRYVFHLLPLTSSIAWLVRLKPNDLSAETRWRASSAVPCATSAVGAGAGAAADVEDLIHLRGPLTEDAVVRALQARFYQHKFYVSTSVPYAAHSTETSTSGIQINQTVDENAVKRVNEACPMR